MSQPRTDIHDWVAELCEPIVHVEHYVIEKRSGGVTMWHGRDHRTEHPSLVDQLYSALSASGSVEEGMRPGFTSKPAASLEAIDAVVRIDRAAARWVRRLGQDDFQDTEGCIRALHALWPSTRHCHQKATEGCCDRHDIIRDVRSWWTTARCVTGWDSPAWKPDATCPLCGTRGTLRVKLAAEAATCIECHGTWDTESIGLLADHIRAESDAAASDREASVKM